MINAEDFLKLSEQEREILTDSMSYEELEDLQGQFPYNPAMWHYLQHKIDKNDLRLDLLRMEQENARVGKQS